MPNTCFIASYDAPTPVDLVRKTDLDAYLGVQSEYASVLLKSEGFSAGAGELVRLPDMTGHLSRIVFGLGDGEDGLGVAQLSASLKGGVYRFDYLPDDADKLTLSVAWADGAYRYTRYKKAGHDVPKLVISDETLRTNSENLAHSVDLLRDLVNTPAQDMSPSLLQAELKAVSDAFGADLTSVVGDDLLEQNYPMIHAVGRAAPDAPRLLELTWGKPSDPKLAIVGKGITFDTGGLNIKTGGYHASDEEGYGRVCTCDRAGASRSWAHEAAGLI